MKYTPEQKEWFRYLAEIVESDTATPEDKAEAKRLLAPVDHRVFNEPPISWRDIW
jgi:hypothetical protein